MNVCAEARGQYLVSCYITLHLTSLRQSLSLNKKIEWQLASLSDPPVLFLKRWSAVLCLIYTYFNNRCTLPVCATDHITLDIWTPSIQRPQQKIGCIVFSGDRVLAWENIQKTGIDNFLKKITKWFEKIAQRLMWLPHKHENQKRLDSQKPKEMLGRKSSLPVVPALEYRDKGS